VVLLQFSVALLLVFILELSGGIAGYVLRDRARDYLKGELNKSMYTFDSKPDTKEVWFELQTTVS
jgi:CD63 antigen